MLTKIFKRPILWGVIFTIIGGVAWVFSIVINVLTLGKFRELSNIIFVVTASSLPAALVLELINWFRRK